MLASYGTITRRQAECTPLSVLRAMVKGTFNPYLRTRNKVPGHADGSACYSLLLAGAPGVPLKYLREVRCGLKIRVGVSTQ